MTAWARGVNLALPSSGVRKAYQHRKTAGEGQRRASWQTGRARLSTALLCCSSPGKLPDVPAELKGCRMRSPTWWGDSGHTGSLSQRGRTVLKAEGQGQCDAPRSRLGVLAMQGHPRSWPGGHAHCRGSAAIPVPAHSCGREWISWAIESSRAWTWHDSQWFWGENSALEVSESLTPGLSFYKQNEFPPLSAASASTEQLLPWCAAPSGTKGFEGHWSHRSLCF